MPNKSPLTDTYNMFYHNPLNSHPFQDHRGHKDPMMLSFDVFFDVRMSKLLNKQSSGWWCETPCRRCDSKVIETLNRYTFTIQVSMHQKGVTKQLLYIHTIWDMNVLHVCRPALQRVTGGDRINSVKHTQYHGCWCPGSLRSQDISIHDIGYVE